MTQWIAERRLQFSRKGEQNRQELVIRIGMPYWKEPEVAACAIEFNGLFDEMPDICGIDTLQAVQLASNFENMLEKLSKKYDFFFHTGEPYFEDVDE